MSSEILIPYKITKGRVPVLVHIPHASTVFPKRMLEAGTVLNPENGLMESIETISDRHMDTVVKRIFAKSSIKPYVFESNISRMFMDPERFDGEEEVMNKVGMGIVYTKNHEGKDIYSVPPTDEQVQSRINRLYKPYSDAFTRTVEHILYDHGRCLIIDAHSYSSQPFPYEIHSDEARTPLVLGYDSFHVQDIMSPLSTLRAKPYASSNTVFKGSYVPLQYLNTDARVSSMMMELRKDTYMDESSGHLLRPSESEYIRCISDDMIEFVNTYLNL